MKSANIRAQCDEMEKDGRMMLNRSSHGCPPSWLSDYPKLVLLSSPILLKKKNTFVVTIVMLKPGFVEHTCYPNTWEAAAKALCPEGHPVIYRKNLT